jgi:6,7-dimethyl-8-ribityllumazine synthase
MQRDAEKTAPHILIVEARFYTHIADFLVEGAIAEIKRRGARCSRVSVPGAFEIPAAIRMAVAARHGMRPDFDGFVALGCVIRGETSHYDYVCGESARGLMELSLNPGLAIGYGILTVENEAQALVRAKPDQKNKGGVAASACLDMIALRQTLATLE